MQRGLGALLRPRSVAVVGASQRPGSNGNTMVRQLIGGGFAGQVAAVNPKYEEVEGIACFPSLVDVPGEVDLAILGVPNAALEDQLTLAAERSIRAAVIFASGYLSDPEDTSLIDRLKGIARTNDITICGGNCMGFINVDEQLRALAFEEPFGLRPGPISWITHSGSAFTALLHNSRGLGFNLAVSAGQEFTTTVADYVAYAVDQPSTGVIALFIETVRDPLAFRSSLMAAVEADIPVVVLKVGRDERARRLVAAHSGALAGEDAVFDAVFEAHGAMRVHSFNEMAETLELFSTRRRAGRGGLSAIHDSGGERAHLVDAGGELGVPFARLSPNTEQDLAERLEPGLPPVNPLDAWGTGNDFEKIFLGCSQALLDDPDTACFAFVVDLAGEDLELGYAAVAEQIFHQTAKPFAVVSNLAAAIDPEAADRLRASGVPLLEDTYNGLRAFKHLLDYRDHRELPAVEDEQQVWRPMRERWKTRLESSLRLDESEALHLLSSYGIPVAQTRLVAGIDMALDAADEFGYPVVLKATGLEHKSDVGGVRTGLADRHALIAAHKALSESFDSEAMTVQKMAKPGVEISLGIVRDEQFGPVIVLAAGGVLIEVLRDRVLAIPPLDQARAARMIDRLAVRELLAGVRGAPAADVSSLQEAIVNVSHLAMDLGDHIQALDVNPIIVSAEGCLAVDALVEAVPVSSPTN